MSTTREGPTEAPARAVEGGTDWFDVLERLASEDRLAYMELSRLITSVLRGLRAFDFHDDWADVVQDVAMALVKTHREGRLGPNDAIGAYVRQMTRNRFRDRLRAYERRHERDTLDIDAPPGEAPPTKAASADPASALDVRRALDRLGDPQRGLVLAVYGERLTYEEAAQRFGIPLGTAKRQLGEGIKRLRARLSAGGGPEG